MKATNKVVVIDDLFESKVINELNDSVRDHFEHNILIEDFIDVTKSIIDCHGMALTDCMYFPYPEMCWNVLCLKIKECVVKYCEEYGYDSDDIIPFSCWAERVDIGYEFPQKSIEELRQLIPDFDELSPSDFRACDGEDYARDEQVNKHMIRTVYNLKSPDPFFGTVIYFDEPQKIDAKENRLVIYDGSSYRSHHYYPIKEIDSRVKYNIIFDWYINEPFGVPDWILP